MTVLHSELKVLTQGYCDVINISEKLADMEKNAAIKDGMAVIFCKSSTSALTTIEYESGCIENFKQFF